jgi:hypothetical protein
MWLTLEDQVPGGVRGRASGLKLTPLGLQTGHSEASCISSPRSGRQNTSAARFAGSTGDRIAYPA